MYSSTPNFSKILDLDKWKSAEPNASMTLGVLLFQESVTFYLPLGESAFLPVY